MWMPLTGNWRYCDLSSDFPRNLGRPAQQLPKYWRQILVDARITKPVKWLVGNGTETKDDISPVSLPTYVGIPTADFEKTIDKFVELYGSVSLVIGWTDTCSTLIALRYGRQS